MTSRIPCHRNLSVATRNNQVINKINKGATSVELEREYGVQIQTIYGTIRKQHYRSSKGKTVNYPLLLKQLRENNNRVSAQQPETKAVCTPVSVQPVSTAKKKVVYLVETSTMLNVGMDRLLALDDGESAFYIPRFCIEDLEKMRKDDPRAEDALTRMYGEEIFKQRFFPQSNVSAEDSIFKGSPAKSFYKRRTVSVVDAAVQLALGLTDCVVKVLTTSREVCDLTREVIAREKLEGLLSFALCKRNNT